MKTREILIDINALEEDLLSFERKYGVRSDVFYAAYVSGEEPEDDSWVLDFDFGEWGSVYKTWLTRLAEYRIQSTEGLRKIEGVGAARVDKYGAALIELVATAHDKLLPSVIPMKKIFLILAAILFSSTAYSAELPDGFYRLKDSSKEGSEIPYMFKENASEFLDPNDLFIEGKELTYRVEEKIIPAKTESYIQDLQQALPGKFT
ncbi:MAG: hypothetical protein D3904_03900, partial [Candidatus Electrothrix sp. EH2]|nr:hypothetical protein [Candidatus Electrothrix sp. EH2]